MDGRVVYMHIWKFSDVIRSFVTIRLFGLILNELDFMLNKIEVLILGEI